jgi:hypothetical protein
MGVIDANLLYWFGLGSSVGLAWPCYSGGCVSWLVEFHFRDVFEGWVLWTLGDGGYDLGRLLI